MHIDQMLATATAGISQVLTFVVATRIALIGIRYMLAGCANSPPEEH